jgi:transposase InsO family protein
MEEVFTMSKKELERHQIISAVKNKQITQIKAANLLDISTRQVRNILTKYIKNGSQALISKKRGKRGNNSYDDTFKSKTLKLIEEKYQDFGPTLAAEKLLENHQIKISNETLRTWMIEKNLWIPKQRKKAKHRLRHRKECYGELIQVDGSHHDWFEGRREKCVLIVFIDDATSRITSLYFAEGESLNAYFKALEHHIVKHGIPKQIYSDRFSVFQSCKEEEKGTLTQFKYALKLLNISHITAQTPQAKGRVERVNQTLQDRLVKEMRLKGISTIEEANEFLKGYIEKHNLKFSKEPISSFNAHRPLEIDLSRVLSRYEERTLSNTLSIQFHNRIYQICEDLPKNARIEIRKQLDGELRMFFKDKELKYVRFDEIIYKEQTKDLKWETREWKSRKATHPWKDKAYNIRMKEKKIRGWEDNLEKVV